VLLATKLTSDIHFYYDLCVLLPRVTLCKHARSITIMAQPLPGFEPGCVSSCSETDLKLPISIILFWKRLSFLRC